MNVKTAWYKNKDLSPETLLFYVFMVAFFSMPLGTAPPTVCAAVAAAIWLFSGMAFRSKEIYLKKSWCRPVWALIILPWVGMLYTLDATGLGIDYAEKTHYWIYCLAIAAIAYRVNPERFIQAFLIGLAVNAFIGLLQLIGLYPPINGWYCGLGRGYSTLSAYLVVGMLISSFYFRILTDKRLKRYALFLTGFYFFHLIILEGRSGYLIFVVLLPLIIRNILNKFNMFKISVICVLLIGVMFLSPIVRDRVNLSVKQLNHHIHADPNQAWGREYSPHQDRFYMWYGAAHIFLDHPLLGVGTGGYQTALKARGKPDDPLHVHPHNDFLYMAANYGLIGIAVFIWFFGSLLKNSWQQRHTPVGYFVFSTGLVVLVSGLVNAQILDAGMAFLLAFTMGLQQSFPEFSNQVPHLSNESA